MNTLNPTELALSERVRALEKINSQLAAEVDLCRPVIEACQFAKGTSMIRVDSGHSLGKIYDAITAYEAAKEQVSGPLLGASPTYEASAPK